MAGSLNHIIDSDGRFTMDFIENLGDAHEALQECFHIIRVMSYDNVKNVSAVCKELGYPDPWEDRYGDEAKACIMRP